MMRNPFVAKWRKLPSERDQGLGIHRRYRHLEHRDVGRWVHGDEWNVSPVIEPAIGGLMNDLCSAEKLGHPRREPWRTRPPGTSSRSTSAENP